MSLQSVELIRREDHRLGKLRRRQPLRPFFGRGRERDAAIAQGLSVSVFRKPEPPHGPPPSERKYVDDAIFGSLLADTEK